MRNLVQHPVTVDEIQEYFNRRREQIQYFQCIGDMRLVYYDVLTEILNQHKKNHGNDLNEFLGLDNKKGSL